MTTTLVTPERHQENINFLNTMTEQELLNEITKQEEIVDRSRRHIKGLNYNSSKELEFNEYHLETMKSVSKTYRRQEILTQLGI